MHELRFPVPKLQGVGYRLVFHIEAGTMLERRFLTPPLLHYERRVYTQAGLKETHRGTSRV